MQSITTKGFQRESVGKAASKALRNAGQVPRVLYGGDDVLYLSVPELTFAGIVHTPNAYIAAIEVNGRSYTAILQGIQFDPATGKIIHIDLYQPNKNKEIAIEVPAQIQGTSPGVMIGGIPRVANRKLKIKVLPDNFPDSIPVDISAPGMGNRLYIIKLPQENYKTMRPDNTVVCQIRVLRTAMKAAQDVTKTEKGKKK